MKKNLIPAFFLISALLFSSCTRFYLMKRDVAPAKYESRNSNAWLYLDRNNHLVLHNGEKVVEFTNVSFDDTEKILKGDIHPFSGKALYYYEKVKADKDLISRREFNDKQIETHQIHFYIDEDVSLDEEYIQFSLSNIKRIEVTEQAKGMNLLVGLGVAAGTTVVATGGLYLLASVVCNCPHVYVDNGTSIEYNTTLFTGAIAPQLERFDYKQISDYFKDSSLFSISIVNELQEDQYTNMLELIVAQHDENMQIISDQEGKLYSIQSPQIPVSAVDNQQRSILSRISALDKDTYSFNSDSIADLSEVFLNFKAPQEINNGKLILNLKNTAWSGYVYDRFNSLFGRNYTKWVKKNTNKSKEEREAWMRQEGIKLLVDIKTKEGWKNINEVDLIGEVNYNSLVIPVPAEQVQGEQIEIRLRSGFNFWEVDYAAMDFSENQSFEIQVLKPTSALGESGQDYRSALLNDDQNYMEHLNEHSSTKVVFEGLKIDASKKRTLILKSKGYYVAHKEYDGKTARKELQRFETPGELSRFSQQLYLDLMGQKSLK